MSAPPLAALRRSRLVPVVTVHDLEEVDAIASGLADGGVGCIEITLRTPLGLEAIARVAGLGILEVGAGTVLDPTLAEAAVDAGATFVVSPGLDEPVVEAALTRGAAALPGVATASELQRARRAGLDHVKLFPASTLGGIGLVEALHHPFPGMSFLPSGGVTAQSAPGYLAHPAVFAVGSSWLVPTARDGDLYGEVRRRSADAVAALAGAGRG